MTRARKIDPAILEREYIFDPGTDPISITELAARHGLARSGVADKALKGKWFERRKEFRATVGMKVTEAMADDWAAYAVAQTGKMVEAMSKTLDRYIERLDKGEVQPNTRDAVAAAGALRVLIADSAAQQRENAPLDPESMDIPKDALREFIERTRTDLKALPSGEEVDDADFLDTGTT